MMETDVDHLIAKIDPGSGPGMTPGGHELLEEITASSPAPVPERSPWIRRRVALPIAAAAAALAVGWVLPAGLTGIAPSSAAALDVAREGGDYVITVKDLYAAPQRYQEQLRGLGLDITLKVVPATPARVGTNMAMPEVSDDQAITTIEGPGDCLRRDSCTLGIKVPEGYHGKMTILLARKARPGENYQMIAPIDAPGEPLHCTGYTGKTVDEVRSLLQARDVTEIRYATSGGGRDEVPGSWIVHDGVMSAPDRALLLVGPTQERPDAPGPVASPDPCRPA
ncbi:hypothetical protein [Microbispora sp. NPDC049125]|uniref:hypothetical protein n=1 Tax=Microbispora sp. NPDC049125 TaxID=3154929 RepID=UPI003465E85D